MKSALRRMTFMAISFSGLAMVAGLGHASAPVSNWSLEPSSTSCLISRSYGSAQSPTLIGMKAMPEGDGIQLAIIRPAYRMQVDQNLAELVAGGVTIETSALSYPVGERDRRSANLINLAADQVALVRKATTLKATTLLVRITASTHEDFDLGAMADAWASLDSCTQKLRDAWNVENQMGRIVSPAEAIVPLRSLFSADDYPNDAVRENQSGMVVVRLLIDEAGAVKDCTLVQMSGIAILDLRSCGIIMRRAKFKPATDGRGRPVKSSTTQKLVWRLS